MFVPNPPGTGVLCEDIGVAAALLCHGAVIVDNRVRQRFKPGKFRDAHPGFFTGQNETIFLFEILGDFADFEKRRKLFHSGLLFVSPQDYKGEREYLLDAIKVARGKAEKGSVMFPVKGSGNGNGEGEVQGAESVRPDGRDVGAETDGGAGTDSQVDAASSEEGTSGGGQ